MQTDDDKRLDQWTRKVLKETQLESPGSDFTKNIMRQITPATNIVVARSYTPLISRNYWGLIAACSAALIILAFFVQGENTMGIFQNFEYLANELNGLDLVPAKLFPENMAYGILALLFCLGIQVYFIKRQHSRSLRV